ncbi:hypothetical protein O181_121722, partial [Austropuccinia psidii MF-1]|nr:hypothetical protein [Austropuccinia psidii MF-1]
YLLAIKPAGPNSFLDFNFQSLNALATELLFQMLYHHRTCPGRLATLPDALSPQDNVYQERGEDFISKNPMAFQQIINQDEVQPPRYFAVKVESVSNLIDSIQKALWQDYQYRGIL